MSVMSKHRDTTAPLRRARVAAWTVFLSMAGTTIAFQVYHSVRFGQMPELLAIVYGFILLVMCVCILEFIAAWHGAPWWVKAGALAIMGGAMYMSAGATGEVVLHAAPPHMSLLFGFLMDGAALLAVHFILNGPTAAAALAAAAQREAAMRADADAAQAALRAEIAALGEHLAASETARREAETRAAEATAKAEVLTRKLDAAAGPKRTRKPPAKNSGTAGRKTAEPALPKDFDARARALSLLAEDPDISGAELASKCGMSERWGQDFKKKLASHVAAPDAPPDEA